MAMVRKKQDDKHLEALRELITTGGGNRQCFDCGQKGPTYVNMTIGSFVCTRCSGVLRGLTPPHRVKSISMATFTQDEIDFLKAHGNDVCAKTWLGLWDPKRAVHQDQRELMIDKYERKRYYLEPASPLKSLTNATNLKTSSSSTTATAIAASASASSATTSSALSSASNNNNNRSSNNNQNHHTHIQLTPPTSQRTTANGLHKSSSTAISRPHHHSTGQQQQQHNGFATDAFGLHNGLNISVGSASTGALSDTSSCASANGFGAEADFVADFGSADIFNATVASSSPASSVGSASTSNNGYAKIQPLKAAHQQFMNGHHHSGNASNNGNTIMANGGTAITNGNNSNSFANNGNTENFADFDHAPIYNAAGLPMSNAPAADRYAALKDLDEQLRESKAVAAQAASIVTANVIESGFGTPNNGTVNPFATHTGVANPFQSANAPQNTTQLFGQMTLIPNGIAAANGFLNAAQKAQPNAGFFNYTANGFTNNANNANSSAMYATAAGPNGCGFGFGTMQQQIAASGPGLTPNTFNNPFTASGNHNSNNPFL
ncbi:arf-GAP domain and FG repeat-containing protein 1 [Stomoxys calcitrans]|uniref:arf-GAP domain and FG repeat-containing protein 1 n=1 Tax=Stomoxys calcitrans TaxID=35570 RepID=UPI0027E31DAB|nr:arf-GAP domain and FG repeat-containing protein 1 [Stomoxys calcitrans]